VQPRTGQCIADSLSGLQHPLPVNCGAAYREQSHPILGWSTHTVGRNVLIPYGSVQSDAQVKISYKWFSVIIHSGFWLWWDLCGFTSSFARITTLCVVDAITTTNKLTVSRVCKSPDLMPADACDHAHTALLMPRVS